ncbi:MAG: 6-phospho-3-hexuloisomerase [Candidatus Paceibacterota bacterium]|jgi:6-phospho-3-hexuloisomerase
MNSITQLAEIVSNEIKACLSGISVEEFQSALSEIDRAGQIFVTGAGRSGLAMRAFAMRLMHAGKSVHVVGDVTVPSITKDDLLIIGSGSGSTESLLVYAKRAKMIGARLLLLTIVSNSAISELANCLICIPAPSSKVKNSIGKTASVQPMGSLFEQSLFILGDCLILEHMKRHELDGEHMFHSRHANLE